MDSATENKNASLSFLRPPIPDSEALRHAAMQEALRLAEEALEDGEVPVGAVITCDGEIVGRGRNRREKEKDALCHGELEAIHTACRALHGWRLHRCTLYVTLEPCIMCAGAAVSARICKIVYGAGDDRRQALEALLAADLLPPGPRPAVERGFREAECRALLQRFFGRLRSADEPK